MQRVDLQTWERHLLIEFSIVLFIACLALPIALGYGMPGDWAAAALYGAGTLFFRGLYGFDRLYYCQHNEWLVNPRYLIAGFVALASFAIMAVLVAI